MAKQVTDEEASLKRQARRRLIGAVALVTAAAVILPMVLDSEPKPGGVDIELRIPNKDKVEVFRPQAAVAPVPAVALPTVVEAVEPPVPASAVVSVPMATEVKPEAEPAPKPEPRREARPELKSESKADAKPAPKHVDKPAFVLQIGAYANADIAKDWQVKLKKQGFNAYTELAGGRTRLRVGPFASREAAEKARHKMATLKLHPDLVEE